jgi:hypothetical protein
MQSLNYLLMLKTKVMMTQIFSFLKLIEELGYISKNQTSQREISFFIIKIFVSHKIPLKNF